MTKKYAIEMTKADWENIVLLISFSGNADRIGILGVDPEPYRSADKFVAAVKALSSD